VVTISLAPALHRGFFLDRHNKAQDDAFFGVSRLRASLHTGRGVYPGG
jgi:hypothetical protein